MQITLRTPNPEMRFKLQTPTTLPLKPTYFSLPATLPKTGYPKVLQI